MLVYTQRGVGCSEGLLSECWSKALQNSQNAEYWKLPSNPKMSGTLALEYHFEIILSLG